MGITLDFFHIYEKVPVSTQLLNIVDKGFTKAESQILIILMEISSWSCDLLIFKALMFLMISLPSKTIEESLSLLTKIGWLGHSLPLLRGVHWRLKNSLNMLAFSLKSDTSLPSMRRGSIIGIFLPLKHAFSIDQ